MEDQGSFSGKSIGNYRILAHIGSGGFGSVYRGEHSILKERVVAIKILHTHLSTPAERNRFLEEARLIGHIRHPHILQFFDAGLENGLPYLVTEYAPYGSLRDILTQSAHTILPEEVSLTILTQVGEALHYAHQQHIVHRDLKPENILFNAKDRALLADFGIATTLSTSSVKYSLVIGTPSYMAPELFQGILSIEGDQYALGCIAYELFTGHVPFSAPDFFAMGFKHLADQPIAPTQLNPALPMHIERAILKAMAKQRGERHIDVRAFLAALHGSEDVRSSFGSSDTTVLRPAQEHRADEELVTLPAAHLAETSTFVRGNTLHSEDQSQQETMYKQRMPGQKLEERQMLGTGGVLPTQHVQVTPPLESGWNRVPPQQQSHSQPRKSGRRRMIWASIFASVAIIVIASLLFLTLPNLLFAHTPAQTVTAPLTTTAAGATSTVHIQSVSGQPTHPVVTSTSGVLQTPTSTVVVTATSGGKVTPTATPTQVTSWISIDDSVTGTGVNQWNYAGSGWKSCANTCMQTNPPATYYDASQHWADTTNDTATLIFSGTQIKFYGVTYNYHGIGAVSIDGGAETYIDFYSANRAGDVLLWESSVLSNTVHRFVLTITGTHDSSSTGTVVVVDRAQILS